MKHRRASAFLLLFAVLFLFAACGDAVDTADTPKEGEVYVTFLDVGQADCALVRTADFVMVVDTGGSESDGAELLSYLRGTNVERIDLLVLTHPHEDHIGGASALLREYDIGECLMPDLLENSASFRAALSALTQEGCRVTRAFLGEIREYGSLSVEVLSPAKEFYSTVNDACAVVRVRVADTEILFTGDISETVERELLSLGRERLKADILKVAHHGSGDSSCYDFLAAVKPQYAVISCAAGNEYGFPHMETLDRFASIGATVYRTDTEGTVTFFIKGGNILVK